MYDKLLIKYSPHRPIPAFVRTRNFRLFMVVFIFTVFGVQMYMAWGNWNAMGKVFWNIILLTTVVGIVLSFVYAPRTWCSFCPMGTISSWVSPRKKPFPHSFTRVYVDETCLGCKRCARVCPMQLAPYVISGQEEGYLHPDCMKCGKCVEACPAHVMALKSGHSS